MTISRFPWWPYLLALALIVVGALAPIGITVYAANLAVGYGCSAVGGVFAPCIVDGIDKAPELQAMANSFWYALYTWPAGIVAMTVWLLVLFWHRSLWKRRNGLDG